jgi:enoyl-[acyl-carrier protein] reductase I
MTFTPSGTSVQQTLAWTPNEEFAVGKGATVQEFIAVVGDSRYIIDVAPWGEGRFMVDGREIARVDRKDDREAFNSLRELAEQYLKGEPIKIDVPRRSPLIPAAKAKLLGGKRGLIVGIANENSIAWGCARAFRALGTDLAVTYLNDKARKYVQPLADALDAQIVMPLDVGTPGQMESVFERIPGSGVRLTFSCIPSRFRRRRRFKVASSTCHATDSWPPWTCLVGAL